MLQELPVLQEPREHKVLQALPDLPAHRDRLAPPDPQDHRGLPDQQALRDQWDPEGAPAHLAPQDPPVPWGHRVM